MTNKIKLIVYDFDGVMTDNKVYINQNGDEMVQVNRSDGLAVGEIKKMGIDQIIISTEINTVVQSRANKLGIKCFNAIDDKKSVLIKYCQKNNINLNDVAFVGNDINDENAMIIAGIKICPADAHDKIIIISDIVLKSKGGDGVIRELMDLISKYNNYQ